MLHVRSVGAGTPSRRETAPMPYPSSSGPMLSPAIVTPQNASAYRSLRPKGARGCRGTQPFAAGHPKAPVMDTKTEARVDTVIVLFNRDLRVYDHPALAAACGRARRVVPLFVLDDAVPAGNRTPF